MKAAQKAGKRPNAQNLVCYSSSRHARKGGGEGGRKGNAELLTLTFKETSFAYLLLVLLPTQGEKDFSS